MKHEENCRWEMTTLEECGYRQTHHYCPHPEHACSCVKVPAADDHEPYGTCDWGGCDEEVVRWRYSDEIGTHLPVCSAHSLEAENARLREAIGLATTAAPMMEMDASDPVGMMQRVVAEVTRLRAQADALATALRNQGLLQNTFHGKVWHIYDCPASFDFSECNYRCRVAREAFALAGMEPYVSPETRRDTEVGR